MGQRARVGGGAAATPAACTAVERFCSHPPAATPADRACSQPNGGTHPHCGHFGHQAAGWAPHRLLVRHARLSHTRTGGAALSSLPLLLASSCAQYCPPGMTATLLPACLLRPGAGWRRSPLPTCCGERRGSRCATGPVPTQPRSDGEQQTGVCILHTTCTPPAASAGCLVCCAGGHRVCVWRGDSLGCRQLRGGQRLLHPRGPRLPPNW